jgi:surface protein
MLKKQIYILFSTIFLLYSPCVFATVYENGENNSSKNWTVYDKNKIYDKNITSQLISNIFDTSKKSNVIAIKGTEISQTFLLGSTEGEKAWKNTKEHLFKWSMKMKNPSQLMLLVQTKKGSRYLSFSSKKNLNNLHKGNYIHLNLGEQATKKEWKSFSFDIASIIKIYEKENKLISINGFSIQGKGLIDDIELKSNKDDFIANFKINKAKRLHIATNDKYKYNFNINWGDGVSDFNVTKEITHKYAKEGVYNIHINGEYPQLYKLCSKEQSLLSIEQWGSQKWLTMKEAFKDCQDFSTIYTTQAPDLSNVKSMYRMFYNNKNFNADISTWNVSSVNDMSSMFYHAEKFNQDIGSWDLSSVTDTSFMFNHALLFNQDITQWDVSSVEEMQLMFRSAKSFNQDIGIWNVSSVKNMYNIFKDATSFHQNLDKWTNLSPKIEKEKTVVKRVSTTPSINNIYHELEIINGPNEVLITP